MVYNFFRPVPSVPDRVGMLHRCKNLHTVVLMVRKAETEVREIRDLTTLENLCELRIIGCMPSYVPFDNISCLGEPGHFASLVSLHLQNISGDKPDATHEIITPPSLRRFSVQASSVKLVWLRTMLQSARQLRVVEMRDVVICSASSELLESFLNGVQYAQLERLIILGLTVELVPYQFDTLGELGDMRNWNVLTSLTIRGWLLSTLLQPPPRLKHLSLVYQVRYYGKLCCRHCVLKRISKIKHAVERIRADAPGLKAVDLWHPVTVGVAWQAWLLAAFLLHGTCSRLGIELNINLV